MNTVAPRTTTARQEQAERHSNQSLAEKAADALKVSGYAKAYAHAKRKKADRIYDVCFLKAGGKNADERKAMARQMPEFIAADDDAIRCECHAIEKKAEADAAMVLFDNYRTEEATRREDRRFMMGMS